MLLVPAIGRSPRFLEIPSLGAPADRQVAPMQVQPLPRERPGDFADAQYNSTGLKFKSPPRTNLIIRDGRRRRFVNAMYGLQLA